MSTTAKKGRARQSRRPRRWNITLNVVGLRYRGWTRDGRRALSDMIDKRGAINGLQLVREPDNPADEYAIMVFLPERLMDGKQLGYLRREAAELIAPKLDSGDLEVVSAKLESLDEDQDYNEGDVFIVFRDYPRKRSTKKGATKPKTRT